MSTDHAAAAAAAAAGSRISNWFASTPAYESSSSSSVLNTLGASRVLFALQTVVVPLAFWLKPLCVCIALFWLVYRASKIVRKPLDELAALLGFDIPATPLIDLAGVKADGARVHWSIPGKPKHKSQLKVEIHLNGTLLDQLSWHESAVTITGLQPAAFYLVRVALLHSEFSSKSAAIRFRTKPAASDDFYGGGSVAGGDGADTDHEGVHEPVPSVRPYRGLADFIPSPSSTSSAAMAREPSSGLGQMRNASRRPSPAALAIDPAAQEPLPDDMDLQDGPETVQELTEKLESIRRETEEAERLAKEEEEDEIRQKEKLERERDELKAELNERERSSRNLKREVNTLERQNTTAQNERAKLERLLLQKKQERQKIKDDKVRWEQETVQFKVDTERIQEETRRYVEQAAQEKLLLRDRLVEETAKVRALDDEVREVTAEVKKLERVLKDASPNGSEAEPNLVQQLQSEAEEERKWQTLRHNLQQQYSFLFKQLEAAKKYYADQMRFLESVRAERRRQDEMAQYQASTHDRRPQRADSQRSRNAQNRLSLSDSPRMSSFPTNQSPFSANVNPVPPAGYGTSPFFNIQNGMTISGPTDDVALSEEDRERLTGGAAMSPNAAAGLIPTDLFSGDGENRIEHVQPLPGLGSLPGLPGLPGAPAPGHQESPAAGPASPTASSSRSPSVFASPQASQHNLNIDSPNNIIETDRRSIRSTRSTRAPSGGTSSRFSGMFGIKQRNKHVSEEGPPLGKANSMPRQDNNIPGLDAATRKRNSSVSVTVMDSGEGGLDGSTDSPAAAPGRRAFGFFSKDKSGGWPSTFTAFSRRPASPRPGSTHSNELPRPSADNSRWGADAWASTDATTGARSSPFAFGSAWNAPSQPSSRVFGSRHPSRRQSVQYAASGPPEDILEDDDSDALDSNQTPNLAPIGTQPSKKAENAAKLNPNAKDFKSFFSSMKFGGSKDKARESGESSDKNDGASLQASNSNPSQTGAMAEGIEESPPQSRKSRDTRDTRSMTTEESSLAESGRNSPDLVRTPSYTNSDVPAPSPSLQGRESLMQKITRKSSSSKFSLPSFKREKSRLDAPTLASAASPLPAEDEEDAMSESVGSLSHVSSSVRATEKDPRESKEGNRGSRSWSSAFKLGKKKGNETQSLSDRISMASGTEDGDDEEEA